MGIDCRAIPFPGRWNQRHPHGRSRSNLGSSGDFLGEAVQPLLCLDGWPTTAEGGDVRGDLRLAISPSVAGKQADVTRQSHGPAFARVCCGVVEFNVD